MFWFADWHVDFLRNREDTGKTLATDLPLRDACMMHADAAQHGTPEQDAISSNVAEALQKKETIMHRMVVTLKGIRPSL